MPTSMVDDLNKGIQVWATGPTSCYYRAYDWNILQKQISKITIRIKIKIGNKQNVK